ncbi:MAG: putative phage tail protein [Oscillospiraceae bacterium]
MYSLIKSMPSYYKNSKVVSNINNATQIELDTVLKHIETASNQRFVQTADITLDRWEKEYGIPPKNNYDIEFRRTKLSAK